MFSTASSPIHLAILCMATRIMQTLKTFQSFSLNYCFQRKNPIYVGASRSGQLKATKNLINSCSKLWHLSSAKYAAILI